MPVAATSQKSYLKSLYISGFKSFSSDAPQTFEFCEGLNAISGANGAGKSNVLDAILFATAGSEKQLNVSKMRQLIHSNGSKQDKCITIELTFFIRGNIDVLTAKLFRDSDERRYRLNGKSKSVSEVKRWFHTALSLDTQHHSFAVLQNRVTSFVSKSAAELGAVITQATGTSVLRNELSDIEKQVRTNFVELLAGVEADLTEFRDKVEAAKAGIKDSLAAAKLEALVANCGKDIAATEVALLVSTRNEASNEATKAEEEAALAAGKLKNAISRRDNLHMAAETLAEEVALVEQNKLLQLTTLADRATETLQNAIEDENAAKELVSKAVSEGIKYTKKVAELRRKVRFLRSNCAALEEKASFMEAEVDNSKGNSKPITRQQLESLRTSMDSCNKQVLYLRQVAADALHSLQQKISQLEGKQSSEEIAAELQSIQGKKAIAEDTVEISKQKVTTMRHTVDRFKHLCPHGRGTLAELLSLKPGAEKWAEAFQACVGSRWGVEVCDNTDEVKAILAYARANNKAVTVWCVPQLSTKSAANPPQGAILPASLLDYDSSLQPVVDKLFGHTIFCDSVECAKFVSEGYTAVSPEGTVNHAGGNRLTGGYFDPSSNPLKAKVLLSYELDTLQTASAEVGITQEEETKLRAELASARAGEQQKVQLQERAEQTECDLDSAERNFAEAKRRFLLTEAHFSESTDAGQKRRVTPAEAAQARQAATAAHCETSDTEAELAVLETCGPQVVESDAQSQLVAAKQTTAGATGQAEAAQQALKDVRTELDSLNSRRQAATKESAAASAESDIHAAAYDAAQTRRRAAAARVAEAAKCLREAPLALKETAEAAKQPSAAQLEDKLRTLRRDLTRAKGERDALLKMGVCVTPASVAAAAEVDQAASLLQTRQEAYNTLQRWATALHEYATSGHFLKAAKRADDSALAECAQHFTSYTSILLPRRHATLSKKENGVAISVDDSPLQLFSGGQKTMIAVAFLLAAASIRAAPFYLLDEVDAALDETNQSLIAKLVSSSLHHRQVLCITHHPSFRRLAHKIHHLQNVDGHTTLTHVSCLDDRSKRQRTD